MKIHGNILFLLYSVSDLVQRNDRKLWRVSLFKWAAICLLETALNFNLFLILTWYFGKKKKKNNN